MKCPRTGTLLKTVKVGKIEVEISEQSGGVFFDNLELQQFDEKHEKEGEVLAAHLRKFTPAKTNDKERINCPKCTTTVMMRHYYSPQQIIEIDECPSCAGIWLDAGELDLVRKYFLDERSRAVMCDQLEDEVEKQPEVIWARKKYQERMEIMESVAYVLKNIVGSRRTLL
ncbi:zf-TFIIB domain-containing protein [Psychromonas sp.]|nr:zf-TFIIB domain-containing protein [Psychromonas sp.]